MTTRRLSRTLSTWLTLAVATGCSQGQPREPKPNQPADASGVEVTVMAFNVQNLFDTEDDPGKDDKAYLPIEAKRSTEHVRECETIEVAPWRDECLNLDWGEAAVALKLERLAATIKQIDGGRGPDIIALQEIENVGILERLRTEYLQASSYQPAVLLEGTDDRGIDVAFLSRFPLAEPATLHPMEFQQFPERAKDTRGILEATFELPDGSRLTGFSVHFPAPYHPTGMRVEAYLNLTRLLNALPADRPAFAAGDFNTTSVEDAREQMLERLVRPNWTIAHQVGCEGCRGTSYYRRDDTWSFLDMVLFAPPREGSGWALLPDSVRVANAYEHQVTSDGTPARFRLAEQSGVSDHWPIVARVRREPAAPRDQRKSPGRTPGSFTVSEERT